MCTECMTDTIRTLVESDGSGPYYTLRAGHGIWACGVMIVGPQEEVAYFQFTTTEENGLVREAESGDDPEYVSAHVRVLDPVEWVRFFTAYCTSLGKSSEDELRDALYDLEDEVTALFPRLEEFMREPWWLCEDVQ